MYLDSLRKCRSSLLSPLTRIVPFEKEVRWGRAQRGSLLITTSRVLRSTFEPDWSLKALWIYSLNSEPSFVVMQSHFLISLALTIFLGVSLCSGLYEDQVGKFDWKKKFVGKVKLAEIDLKSKPRKVYVATESNVVSAVSWQTGEIIWRQVLENDGLGVIHKLQLTGPELVTVSGSGPYLIRGWNTVKGNLNFEWLLNTEDKIEDQLWDWDENNFYQVRVFGHGIELNIYLLRSGSAQPSSRLITAPWITAETKCQTLGATLICFTGNNVDVLDLGGTRRKKHVLNFSPSEVRGSPESSIPALVLSTEDGRKKIASDFWADSVKLLDAPSTSWSLFQHTNQAVTSLTNENNVYKLKARTAERNDVIPELETEAKWKFPLGPGHLMKSSCFKPEVSGSSCFALVTGEDSSFALIALGKGAMWVREESLARVITVEMLDLPISDNEAAIEKEFASKEGGVLGMLLRRLTSQALQFENIVSSLIGLNEGLKDPRANMVKDAFGLHKLIIAVTESAKIFGIDNENGEIVWQKSVSGAEPCVSLGGLAAPLYIQRTTRVLPHSPIWTALLRDKDTKNSILYSFNPITGQSVDEPIRLDYKIVQAALLPSPNTDFIRGLIVLSKQETVHVFPESTLEEAQRLSKGLFLYTVDPDNSEVRGYTYSLKDQERKARITWNLRLPGKIFAAVSKNPHERVHSQGRVLGDRSVLYKYINPNLIAVGTLQPDAVHKTILTVYLIDTVDGRIVFGINHKRVSEPVHFVHSENWLTYSYYSDKFRRTELIVLDLFEGKTQKNTTAFSSFYYPITPFVERQAYIFPHNIASMKETVTEKGITSKHVLVALTTGRVIEVPWALLDPRRPITVTQEMREEGVLPYIPEINLPPEAIITYNHTLHNVVGIHTSPSGLESTCLVFIYGLDLFYIRVAPSKTFDVLKDDFEYWLISAVLLGLTAAAYVTKRLSARKALRQAWK